MVLHYAIVQQLTFFTFVCITQLFLALWYTYYEHALGDVQFQSQRKKQLTVAYTIFTLCDYDIINEKTRNETLQVYIVV